MMIAKKIFNIIIVTSAFWFSITILVLMFSNEVTRQSLVMLNPPVVLDATNNHYMHLAGVKPLQPHHRENIKYPWETEMVVESDKFAQGWKKRVIPRETISNAANLRGGNYQHRTLYDASKEKFNGGLGSDGTPAYLTDESDKKMAERYFSNHSYNWVLSDKISLDRTLKDVRSLRCQEKFETYPVDLPTTSVVICFHNEHLKTLLRTVHSVINRTPPELLKDIILVDDASHYDNLKGPLDKAIAKLPKVKIVRNLERAGLVRARLNGAAQAHGDVLTFLDSHCECTPGWVEPLLARIKENRANVVCPAIEVINADSFTYQAAANVDQRGGFSWDLFFKWRGIPPEEQKLRKDDSDNIRTPTMAGGLFSIHRQYFYDSGSYDEEMDIWGGENLELSFRIWMCGGRLEIVPCSRVGHVFRKYTSPYKFPNGVERTLAKNFNRLAEVWMDEFKDLYYNKKPQVRNMPYGDISARVELRKRLKCKSFKWYLDNIFPDAHVPDMNPPAQGEVRNPSTGYCLDSLGVKSEHSNKLGIYVCHGQGNNQFFVWNTRGEIIFEEENCLDVSKNMQDAPVEILKCHGMGGNQKWEHDKVKGTIKHWTTQQCLDRGAQGAQYAVMNPCDGRDTQRWIFSKYKQ